MYDPFGYYRDKNIYSIDKNQHVPFYEDIPVSDNQWFIGESYVQIDSEPENFLENENYKKKLLECNQSNPVTQINK